MKLRQEQNLALNTRQIQGVRLLQMGACELDSFLLEAAVENPLIEPESLASEDGDAFVEAGADEEWTTPDWGLAAWHDPRQSFEPLEFIGVSGGLEETLTTFLRRQLEALALDTRQMQVACFVADCLDEDGYFRDTAENLAVDSGLPESELAQALERIRGLEPAGVGARGPGDCLSLQLERIHAPAYVTEIARNRLELLAAGRLRALAKVMGIAERDVLRAAGMIRQLEPRPGSIFQSGKMPQYIRPDVQVLLENGRYAVRFLGRLKQPFRLSEYYLGLMKTSGDPQVLRYLGDKLSQAQMLQWAVEQRGSTLLRCAQAIVERQQAFFRHGPSGLQPFTISKLAEELGLHPSTVSRAIKNKYMQCSRKVLPYSYFFASPAAQTPCVSKAAIMERIRQLVSREAVAMPLTDQSIAQQLMEEGYDVPRRTVAKYRQELQIPPTSQRRGK